MAHRRENRVGRRAPERGAACGSSGSVGSAACSAAAAAAARTIRRGLSNRRGHERAGRRGALRAGAQRPAPETHRESIRSVLPPSARIPQPLPPSARIPQTATMKAAEERERERGARETRRQRATDSRETKRQQQQQLGCLRGAAGAWCCSSSWRRGARCKVQ